MDRADRDSDTIAASRTAPASFAAVFDRHFDAVHAYLQRRIGRDMADELAAETFLVAFDTRARYDVSRPDARPWLFGIATNLLHRRRRDGLRQLRAYARSAAAPDLDAFDGIEARLDASSMRRELVDALARVPAEELDALLLFAWADFSYAEIAEALAIPTGTVRSRLSRARNRIRKALEAEAPPVRRQPARQRGRQPMNEIELLRELRPGLPGPTAEVRAAARTALLARAERSERSARRPPLWRRRGPRLLVALALAIVLVALPVAILSGGGKVQPAAAQVLRRTAEVAATQEPVYPGRGQYLYTRSRGAYLSAVAYNPDCPDGGTPKRPCETTDEWSVLVPSEHESWVSFDDSLRGRVRDVTGRPRFVSADQRAGWIAAGSPPLPRVGQVEDTTISGGGLLSASEISKLPTDPAALRKMIEAREIRGVEGPPGEAETFALIGDMLREAYLPSEVRAALYRLTAELPGVELLGEVEDPVGRPGTGIAYTDRRRGTRHELIFDPQTSALLGERQSLVRSGTYGFAAPPGTATGYVAYLESKVVDSVGQKPPAGAGKLDMSVGCYEGASLHAGVAILHDPHPLALCARLWRKGEIGLRLRRLEREGKIDRDPARFSPRLFACAYEGSAAALVFPAPDPSVCRRLGLVPWKGW